uniref:Uncharacterized protein n=1 Tax=Labrus bergylta TaxID=56723 RepID=A0A3Q3FYE3_9LABR
MVFGLVLLVFCISGFGVIWWLAVACLLVVGRLASWSWGDSPTYLLIADGLHLGGRAYNECNLFRLIFLMLFSNKLINKHSYTINCSLASVSMQLFSQISSSSADGGFCTDVVSLCERELLPC